MDGSSQHLGAYVDSSKAGKTYLSAMASTAHRARHVAHLVQASARKARAIWHAQCSGTLSRLHILLPTLLKSAAPEPADEHDPVRSVMGEFEALDREQQDRVAKNLALLWGSFNSAFGGVSTFKTASALEQQAYIAKLEAAARRMEAARGTEAAFHYVTVELLRQYVSFLQIGSTDEGAVALARLVAPLIDRGHAMNAEPGIYPIK